MSDYQKALAAARRIENLDPKNDSKWTELLARDAVLVARMLLKNHDISHGEKPK